MARRWESRTSPPNDTVRGLSRSAGISDVLSTILINRGITDPEKAHQFLHPALRHLPSPFLIEGMERAVDRIILALKRREKIMLYGDYDVDGISAVSVVYLYMKSVGASVDYHIPSRLDEGYGLHIGSIKRFVSNGYSLLITLDCGIANNDEIQFAQQNNIDTIIADHHEIPDTMPPAYAILDPKNNSVEDLSVIAGVGVAFNLLMALRSTMKKEGFFNHAEMPNLKHYLDLVALGTIADIVPLVGENRTFISAGMPELQKSERFGIQALKDISSLSGDVRASDVSFRIAPRINAAGRLDNPAIGVQLLTADNPLLAARLADTLDRINTDRQQIEQRIFRNALELIRKDPFMLGSKGIVLASEEWHPGVIGIVASKLVEAYYRPTILISLDSGMGKGSARSIKPIHIYETLKELSEYLVGFGGHRLAAGLLIKAENLKSFRDDFYRLLDATLTQDMLVPSLSIDAVLGFREITKKLVSDLGLLMPYGPGNAEPVFTSYDVKIADPVMLKNNVLRCRGVQDGSIMNLVSFNAVASIDSLPKYANIAYYVRNNVYNGSESVELVVKDVVSSRN